ncbi:MAG: CFI-box-CTERM domain-containing protein [Gammaproteobacteria bacterium]
MPAAAAVLLGSGPAAALLQVDAQTPVSIEKSVEPEVPAIGQPVEFTITVINEGTDVETDVTVTDVLPDGLSIPNGMAPFTSQGDYDVQTGIWTVGDVAMMTNAVLTIPAQLDVDQPCYVNTAELLPSTADSARGDLALAVVRNDVLTECVELSVESLGLVALPPFCSTGTSAQIVLTITNNGPSTATDVSLRASDVPTTLPNARFESCAGNNALECALPPLGFGESTTANFITDSFENATPFTASVAFSVTVGAEDYVSSNNDIVVSGTIPSTSNPTCNIETQIADGGGGCFIATAAWGATWDDNVVTLTRFRDEFLLHHGFGRRFVAWYYRTSPPFADYIRERPALRAGVRAGLTPVVMSIRYPWRTTATLVLLLGALGGWRRRRTKQTV